MPLYLDGACVFVPVVPKPYVDGPPAGTLRRLWRVRQAPRSRATQLGEVVRAVIVTIISVQFAGGIRRSAELRIRCAYGTCGPVDRRRAYRDRDQVLCRSRGDATLFCCMLGFLHGESGSVMR